MFLTVEVKDAMAHCLRLCLQEFLYNMGRATHQIGLMHLAVHYYEQALATPPPVNEVGWNMEAAHNLIQIFKDSGAIGLARDVMIKHLTI